MTDSVRIDCEYSVAPYPHFLANSVFDPDSANALLDWLEHRAEWHLHVGDFFEQYECNLLASPPPDDCAHLFREDAVNALRRHMEKMFDVELTERMAITAHKLVPGQGIGIHTDEPRRGRETHRLVVQLNRGFQDENGGHLLVLRSEDPGDIVSAVRPLHNTGFGFAMSDRSFHAVSDVRQGERYTIVYSFWRAEPDRQQARSPEATELESGEFDRDELAQFVTFLVAAGADEVRHSDDNLLSHLVNTFAQLVRWSCPRHLCVAGLFHSIYGTSAFRNATVDTDERQRITDLIGASAEELAYLYGIGDRQSLHAAAAGCAPFRLLDFRDGSDLPVTEQQVAELILLDLANSLEQLPRLKMEGEELVFERNTYLRAGRFLPDAALDDLIKAYVASPVEA